MKELKKVGEYKIYEKRSGRYAVKDANKAFLNGDAKAKVLLDAGLIKLPEPKPAPVEEAAAEEAPAEEASEE
jgi:hypothetical protein